MSAEEYSYWNDTSVAHMFIRLLNKTNYSTIDEFNKDYEMLKGYIEWKRINKKNGGFSMYNFSIESMTSFIDLISYDANDNGELTKIWNTKMLFQF